MLFHCARSEAGGTIISFNLLTSICQFGNFLADKWRRACFVKWSLLMNLRLHIGQANFFSPVCVLRWRDSSSERANLLSQPFQLQLNGFSPKIQNGRNRAFIYQQNIQFFLHPFSRNRTRSILRKILICAVNTDQTKPYRIAVFVIPQPVQPFFKKHTVLQMKLSDFQSQT